MLATTNSDQFESQLFPAILTTLGNILVESGILSSKESNNPFTIP